jgi:hypothetical protein
MTMGDEVSSLAVSAAKFDEVLGIPRRKIKEVFG